MKPIELLAKDYPTRQDLERKVSSTFGLTTDRKECVIKGSTEELKRLHLGDGSILWGISIEATDKKPPSPATEKVNRGKVFKPKLESVDVKGSQEL